MTTNNAIKVSNKIEPIESAGIINWFVRVINEG